jgi:hypothetical protein
MCLLISLLDDSTGQISFSTDWGSGKRSFLQSYENICKSKLEQSLIYDIASLVQVSCIILCIYCMCMFKNAFQDTFVFHFKVMF